MRISDWSSDVCSSDLLLFWCDQFPDDRSEAFRAQVDRKSLGTARDPLDQQPGNTGLLGREQSFPKTVKARQRIDHPVLDHGGTVPTPTLTVPRSTSRGAKQRQSVRNTDVPHHTSTKA